MCPKKVSSAVFTAAVDILEFFCGIRHFHGNLKAKVKDKNKSFTSINEKKNYGFIHNLNNAIGAVLLFSPKLV